MLRTRATSTRDAGRFVSGAGFLSDGRKAVEPLTQIIKQDDRAAPAFAGDQFTGFDCLVDRCAARARSGASLSDTIGKWSVHVVLALDDALKCAETCENMPTKLGT